MKIVLLLIGIWAAADVSAQMRVDLRRCREMALESSRKMAVAEKQVVKAGYDRKAYRANFFPEIVSNGNVCLYAEGVFF